MNVALAPSRPHPAGLLACDPGQRWARWFTIVLVTVNVFAQLGFLGNSQYPLWALTELALKVVVLFALTARWKESQPELTYSNGRLSPRTEDHDLHLLSTRTRRRRVAHLPSDCGVGND
jgi:hypothetical protein